MQSSTSRRSFSTLCGAGRKPFLGLPTKMSGRRYDDDECATPMSDRTTSSCRTPLSGIDRLQRRLEKDARTWGLRGAPLGDRKETLEKKNNKLKKMINAMRRGLKNPSSEADMEYMKYEKVAENDPTVAWELLRRTDWQQMNKEEWAVLRGTFLDLLKAKTEKEEENINLRGQVERILQAGVDQLGILEQKTSKQVAEWREQVAKLLESKDYEIERLLRREKETSRQISQLSAQLRTISASKAKQQGSPGNGTGIGTFGVHTTARGATSGRLSQNYSVHDARATESPEDNARRRSNDTSPNNAKPRAKSQSPRWERNRSHSLRQQDASSALKQQPQRQVSPQQRNGYGALDRQFHSIRTAHCTSTTGFAADTRCATNALLAGHLSASSPRRDSSSGPQATPANYRDAAAPAGGPVHTHANAHTMNEIVSAGNSARDSRQHIPEEQRQQQDQHQHQQQEELEQQYQQQQNQYQPQQQQALHQLRTRAMEPLLLSTPMLSTPLLQSRGAGNSMTDRVNLASPKAENASGGGMLKTAARAEGSVLRPFPHVNKHVPHSVRAEGSFVGPFPSQLRSPGIGLSQNSPMITPRQIPQIHSLGRLKPPPVLTSTLSIGGGNSASTPHL